jgi:hypothetical protein
LTGARAARDIHAMSRAVAIALTTVVLLSVADGCKRSQPQPGRWVPCSCPYLTDYDDRATHKVDVCAADTAAAPQAALDCAARVQPAHFDPCACGAPAGSCDGTEPCRSRETR